VLGVNQQPVIAAEGQLFYNGRAVGIDKQAKLRLTFTQLFLELRSTQTIAHLCFSPVLIAD
jgi:hypothetical protein